MATETATETGTEQAVDQQAEQTPAAPVEAAPESPISKIHPMDVESILLSATPEQLARLRMVAAAQGLSASVGPRKTADGSSVFEIQISADLMAQIEQWSDALPPGNTLSEQVQHWVTEALTAYLYADFTMPPAAAVAAPKA